MRKEGCAGMRASWLCPWQSFWRADLVTSQADVIPAKLMFFLFSKSRAAGVVVRMKVETDLQELRISFSHVHLYVDYVEDLSVYLKKEQKPTTNTTGENNDAVPTTTAVADSLFVSHNRDVVHQLLVGLGFRITGHRYDSSTRTVLVTSCDPRGVQFVVTSLAKTAIKDNNNNNNNNNNKTLEHDIVEDSKEGADTTTTSYRHFAAGACSHLSLCVK